MTDSIVPLGLAITVANVVFHSAKVTSDNDSFAERKTTFYKPLAAIVCSLALLACVNDAWFSLENSVRTEEGRVVSSLGMNTTRENRKRVMSDWIAVCDWVNESLPPDELLLTPRNQQSFKWYAQRAEVVNWKDVPQDAESLIEWRRRFFEIFPLRLGTVRTTVRYPD